MYNLISKNFYELIYYNMKEFNMKQWLMENKSGAYSKTILTENQLMDSEILGKEIAKAHPELIRYRHDGETKKYQDTIFKYAGEMLQGAGVSLQQVRGLAMDQDWAMELVSTVGDELEHGEGPVSDYSTRRQADDKGYYGLKELNPAALGAPQADADAKMQQQDDENGDTVNNASMDVMAEEPDEDMTGFVNKVAPAETGLSKYLDLIHNHDWFHHFSDDPRAWRQGQAEKADLKSLYSTLTPDEKQKAMDAFIDKYLEIHDPKQFPNAANNVKYLTTNTFKGSI